jgi:DNA (cytosine-5)-methyltransferase 1
LKPRLLDLYCCAGGASMGYAKAGFEVVGVDIAKQPHYPFPFIRADVLDMDPRFLATFDAVAASPPCQAYTLCQRIMDNSHPDLVAPTRAMLRASGRPYVIENVVGAPLQNPITLCGAMFGLRTYRHREFECSFPVSAPDHPAHVAPLRKMGRKPLPGDFMHVVGNFSGVAQAKEAMGIDWMVRDELREAIPPAYTEYLGRLMLAHIASVRAAA